ncbi:hypothetical protein HJD18_03735 [Thermoleophilia bacterium SCSIO 60948]|nr:hypothetical protein HJD18_03735 [Thermoleophilia bacterium SCSIO 60948]
MRSDRSDAPQVTVAGGGIAGVEAALAVAAELGDDARVSLVSPDPDLTIRALTVDEPFRPRPAERHELEPLLAPAGVALVRDSVTRIAGDGSVELGHDRRLHPDHVIVCVGARGTHALTAARTFWGGAGELRIDQMLRRARAGERRGLGLIVPEGTTWPLPIYEIALLARRRARELGGADVPITIYTPEDAALAIFGPVPSAAVAELLGAAGIGLVTGVRVGQDSWGNPFAGRHRIMERALISLPRLAGPNMPDLPSDRDGFTRVDEWGRVVGSERVWAAGDGTDADVKQGGIAAQAADAAAHNVAADLVSGLEPRRPTRVLRGRLFGADESLFLLRDLDRPDDPGQASSDPLWWPPQKVGAEHLAEALTRQTWRGERLGAGEELGSALSHEWHGTPLTSPWVRSSVASTESGPVSDPDEPSTRRT